MSDPNQQVSLPHSVGQLIHKICIEQNQPAPDATARQALASLGEEAALEILRTIDGETIRRSFGGFILHLIKKRSDNNWSSPRRRLSLSPFQSQNRSPDTTIRLMNSPDARESQSYSPVSDHLRGSRSSSGSHMENERTSNSQYVALGELEFRKAFLILSYIGKERLEEVITADDIRRLKDLPMVLFESAVWKGWGVRYIDPQERRMSVDWDSGKTHLYHCHVSPDGSYTFKGPYLNQTRTHLQRELGDDNVLMVKFAEETGRRSFVESSNEYSSYKKIAREGILVGLRRYHFFVFKDGGKEEKKKDPTSSSVKCYFVRLESDASVDKSQQYILSGKTVHEARTLFMHVHTVSNVANYMSRLSLILSKTMKLKIDLANVTVDTIEDIPCCDEDGKPIHKDGKLFIHTDGTGFISEDLALKCPSHVFKGKCNNDDNIEKFNALNEIGGKLCDGNQPEYHNGEPPLLMQVRLFNKGCAVKGTLLVNKKLPPQTIQIRRSMIKVKTDPNLSGTQTFNSLELVNTSNQPRKAYLSKNLIALLSYGGVPEKFFEDILRNALTDARDVFSNKRNALKVSLNYGGMDDLNAARMILSGIPLDESYLQFHLSILRKEEKKSLQAGKLPVTDSYYLMGTVDPTGILKRDEVCIILNDGQVSWEKVLVYRNPGLHFGDIHVLKARYVKELEEIIGNAKYAIFFPSKSLRSLADEIAGGDFDGDMYFVSRNPELLKHFKESEPWNSTSSTNHVSPKRPSDFSSVELEDELFKLFLTTRFNPSYAKSVAADSWRAIMDRLLSLGDENAAEKEQMKENIYRLIDIYYDALDAPKKSGRKVEVPQDLTAEKYPCHMGRDESSSFESFSILGKIYKAAKSKEAEDLPVKEVWKLPCFEDSGVPESCKTKWRERYGKYREDMTMALNGEVKEEADNVIKKYKQILYDGVESFEESTRSVQEIYDEALAIYNITYDHAKSKGSAGSCRFAWKVAGAALCKLYTLKQGERTMACIPSVLKEVFG